MSKTLRLTEKWMHRGLWLVALVFAGFLIGLGGTVVGDLPKVEKRLRLDDFMDAKAVAALRGTIKNSERAGQEADSALEQAQLKRRVAEADTAAARETFNNWLATRRATQLADQDAELLSRTKALDGLKDRERAAGVVVEAQQQTALDARQTVKRERRELGEREDVAQKLLNAEQRRVELRVFLYRLTLTLPLLVIAGWLFVKKRRVSYWPFVWGSSFLPCSCFLSSWCPICLATAAMCATSSALRSQCWWGGRPSCH